MVGSAIYGRGRSMNTSQLIVNAIFTVIGIVIGLIGAWIISKKSTREILDALQDSVDRLLGAIFSMIFFVVIVLILYHFACS